MYLELADEPNYQYLQDENVLEYMVQVPDGKGGFIWVREDLLDNLTDKELYEILQMQPHLNGIRDMFQKMRARRQERKATRKQTKFDWREQKRAVRAERKGGGILDRLTKSVGSVVSKLPGGQSNDVAMQPMSPGADQKMGSVLPQFTGDLNVGVAKWYQNPLVIGALVVGTGITAYALTHRKK